MAYIRNIDPNPNTRILPDHGVAIEPGEWAELPDEVAHDLALNQGATFQLVDEGGKEIEQPKPDEDGDGESDDESDDESDHKSDHKRHKRSHKATAATEDEGASK